MLEELLPYYERELGNLRQLAGEFATRFPRIGRRLQIEGDQCEDPHVERLIEAFAFLAARIHRKLDDEYPEITEAFIQVLYPHYVRPIPSATILQFSLDPDRPELSGRHVIPRHQGVLSPEVHGVRCRFRTSCETVLWPIALAEARLELSQASEYLRTLGPAAAVLTLELATQGNLRFADLKLDRLRFFLDGHPPLMHLLYELLLTGLAGVRVSDGSEDPARAVRHPPAVLQPAGFAAEEALLDSDPRSFSGYRLLSEYFAFPDKFLFLDLAGLDHPKLLHPGKRLRIQFLLSDYGESERHVRLLETLGAENIKLGCAPVVNLFPQAADPIRVTHQQSTYPVVVDGRRPAAFEVHAIDSVTRIATQVSGESREEVPPFYAVRHFGSGTSSPFYWYATRERSTRKQDKGTEVELALVDLAFRSVRPGAEVLSLDLTCSNRDLPEAIPFGGTCGLPTGFTVPNQAVVKHAGLLRKPTPSLRPPPKRGFQWRLISHLCLNQLSLAAQGKEALQEVLGLYNPSESAAIARQIQGIVSVQARAATARLPGKALVAFARGVEISVTFDETCYVGSCLFLFASVLERFFAHFCPPNSFVKFRMSTLQREGEVAQWPPRAGEMPLI